MRYDVKHIREWSQKNVLQRIITSVDNGIEIRTQWWHHLGMTSNTRTSIKTWTNMISIINYDMRWSGHKRMTSKLHDIQ